MRLVLTFTLGVVVNCALPPDARAQTPAELQIQTYVGLSVTGTVGTVYSIEYVTDLAQTNKASAWRCLEFLQLPASPYLWADKSTPATGRRFYRAVESAAPTNMLFIPPGTFRMGSSTNEFDRGSNEGPQTAVTISRGFWMGKYEVTQGEYLAVMGANPSYFNGIQTNYPAPPGGINFGADLTRPVESVSWYDATNYCARLTQRERLAGRIASNSVFRLPTEAEWEYACRGWTSTRFS
jgi:formylglycine-generating enzyme required for sulfatase activity